MSALVTTPEEAPSGAIASGRRAAWAVAAVVPAVAAAVAGGAGLTRPGLAEDEAATMYAARLHYPQLVHLLKHLDLVHGVYYAAMHLVVLLGGGIVAVRSISLVATVLAAGAIGLLGRRLTGSAVSGTVAGLVFALSPTADAYAKNARSYGVLPLLVVGTMAAFLWAARPDARRRAWLLYFGAMLVTAYVHELSLLLLTGMALTLAMVRVSKTVWVRWAVCSAAVVVLALPLLYETHREDRAVAWIGAPGVRGFYVVLRTYSGPSRIAMGVFAVGAVAAVVAGVRAWRRSDPALPGDRRLLAAALPIAVVPAALLVIESNVGVPLFDYRYVSYYLPAVALVVGHGLVCVGRGVVATAQRLAGQPPTPRAVAAGAAVVGVAGVAVALVSQLHVQAKLVSGRGYRGDYGAVATQVLANAQAGDCIAYLPPNLRYLPDGYPQLRRLDDFALRVSPTDAGNFRGKQQPVGVTLARMTRCRRVWVVSDPTGFFDLKVRRQRAALQRDFTARRRWLDHGLVVTLRVRSGA